LAAAYSAEKPNVTVEIEAAPDQVTGEDRLDRALTAGTAADVFLVDHQRMPKLLADDRVQPLDELMEERNILFGDNFERLGLEAFAADSALQCMPNEVSPYVVFYNRRLLAPSRLVAPDEEPPTPEEGWQWEQFVLAAEQMSTGGVKGVYLPPKLTTLLPLVRSDGEDLTDDPREPTTLTFADDGARASLEEILTLARDTRLTPTPAQLAREDAVTRFENGRIGMMIGTRALVPRLREKPGLNFDVYPLPRLGAARSVAEISGYCINKESKVIPDAADFVAFASGEKGASFIAESGGFVPANLAALHSDAFVDPGRFPRNTEVFSEAIRRADALPAVPGWSKVVSQTQPFIDRLFYAPVLDLDTLLPRIDEVSAALLAPPTESPSP
jgi:multiple sugar transport system substrate-binding protein